MNRWCWGPHLHPRETQQKQNHRLKTQTDNANDGYEISYAPCIVQWQHNRVALFIATYLRHNTKLTLFVTSKASSARTKH